MAKKTSLRNVPVRTGVDRVWAATVQSAWHRPRVCGGGPQYVGRYHLDKEDRPRLFGGGPDPDGNPLGIAASSPCIRG